MPAIVCLACCNCNLQDIQLAVCVVKTVFLPPEAKYRHVWPVLHYLFRCLERLFQVWPQLRLNAGIQDQMAKLQIVDNLAQVNVWTQLWARVIVNHNGRLLMTNFHMRDVGVLPTTAPVFQIAKLLQSLKGAGLPRGLTRSQIR